MKVARSVLRGVILACLLLTASAALAVDYTNNGTIASYSGTSGDDNLVNNGIIQGDVDMTQGGRDTVSNANGAEIQGSLSMSGNGGTITNNGAVIGLVYGNYFATGDVTINNGPTGAFNSDVTGIYYGLGSASITNAGVVTVLLYGNYGGTGNVSINNSGMVGNLLGNYLATGNVTINNTGTVAGQVLGNWGGTGEVTITNSATGVIDFLVGNGYGSGNVNIINAGTVSYLYGIQDGAGSVSIINSGTVANEIYGNYQSGGVGSQPLAENPVVITNSGSANNIYGNFGGTGDVTITNTGSVGQDIYGNYHGTGDVAITNSGGVGRYLYGNYYGTGDVTITNSASVTNRAYGNYHGTGDVNITNSGSFGNYLYGNYYGTGDVTINNAGSLGSYLYGNFRGTGDVTINNTGSVTNRAYGNYYGTGDVAITNSGSMASYLYGNDHGTGNVTITNSLGGSVLNNLYGSYVGQGNVSIVNAGTVNATLYGRYYGSGAVTINNSGTVVGTLYGNYQGTGNVTITNSGSAAAIHGNYNGSGSAAINNTGLVTGNIYGNNQNMMGPTETVNNPVTITNSGTVGGTIIANSGAGNSYITNSGTVGGDIYGGSGDDTVTMLTGSNVTGIVDGGGGTNTLNYQVAGSIDQASITAKYFNFQNYCFGSTGGGATTLTGVWNLAGNFAVAPGGSVDITGTMTTTGGTVVGGTLNVYGHTLNTASLDINGGGTANINGDANVSGATSVGGTLNVNSGGTLNTGSLGINSGGTANITGTTNVTGGTVVDGTLNVNSGGILNTGSLGINSGGTANIYGTTKVSGATTVAGILNVGSGGGFNSNSLLVNGGGNTSIAGTATVTDHTQVDGSLSVASGGNLTTGSLGISQGGAADVSGTLNAGSTDCAGLLHVNGALNSGTVVIRPSGYLWGSGAVNGGLTLYGTVAPGNSIGTLHVNGSLSFMPGSIYQAEISSDGKSDLIAVDGTASINGGRVSTGLPQALYKDRFAWNILTATGGVSGSFTGVDGQPKSHTLSLHAVSYADHVNLEVWRKPFASFAPGGAGELGAGLDGLVPLAVARKDSLANLIYTMDWSYSREQIASALVRLSPEMYTSYLSAGLEGSAIFDGALQRRQDETRLSGRHNLHRGPQGESLLAAVAEEAAPPAEIPVAGPQLQGWSFWGGALGSWSSRASGGGRLGWRQDLGGLAGGLDGKITDWLSLGLGLGATQSRLNWGQSYLSGGLKGLHSGLYAGAEAGGLHGQAALTYSQYQANGRRDIELPSASAGQATSDFRSWVGQARLGGGYEWRWQDWLTGPIAGLRYARIQQDGFREGGAGACSLGIEEADQDSLTSRLGWQASTKLNLGGLEIMPRLSLEWLHEYASGDPEITARFPGYESAPFRVSGQAPVADMALLRAGLTARVRDRFAAFVEYDAGYAADYSVNAIQAGLQFQF